MKQTKLSEIEKGFDGKFCQKDQIQDGFIGDEQGVFFTPKDIKSFYRQEIKDLVKEIVKEMRMEKRLTRKKNPTEIETGLVLGFNSAKNIQNQKLDKILKRWGVKK